MFFHISQLLLIFILRYAYSPLHMKHLSSSAIDLCAFFSFSSLLSSFIVVVVLFLLVDLVRPFVCLQGPGRAHCIINIPTQVSISFFVSFCFLYTLWTLHVVINIPQISEFILIIKKVSSSKRNFGNFGLIPF